MFVHLRLHTEFSVVDGTNRIDEIVKAAAKDQQPALGISDLSNLFGGIKFYKEARGKGVKPVVGAEIFIEGLGAEIGTLSRIVLLVQNRLPEYFRVAGARLHAKHRKEPGRDQTGLAARIA
jgi:DNA polymerase-3 subunit alpha